MGQEGETLEKAGHPQHLSLSHLEQRKAFEVVIAKIAEVGVRGISIEELDLAREACRRKAWRERIIIAIDHFAPPEGYLDGTGEFEGKGAITSAKPGSLSAARDRFAVEAARVGISKREIKKHLHAGLVTVVGEVRSPGGEMMHPPGTMPKVG